MKKGLLTSLICFTSMVLFSCGSKTVKVQLIGDEYISWGKSEDTASIKSDYVIKANSKVRGYTLYTENLEVKINGNYVIEGEKYAYTYDANSLTLRIKQSAIIGDIYIKGTGVLKITYLTLVVPANYKNITSITGEEHNIESGYNKRTIQTENSKLLKEKSEIQVYPNDVNFTYELNSDKTSAEFEIKAEEFYRDITITFPELD